jgi:hypothetical protein
MRATLLYGARDVRVETVPDAEIVEPTDAVITVTKACICGSDLWPYKSMEPSEVGRPIGHEAVGVVLGRDGDGSSRRRRCESWSREDRGRGRRRWSVRLARQRARRAEELDAVLERECCDRCDLV